MSVILSLDALVRARLKNWPQRPPGIGTSRLSADAWLRARPCEDAGTCHPFIKLPGSTRLRTLPDGLWLNFGGTEEEPFADIFAIEACSTIPNMLDKRARFAPSTSSLMAVCPVPWLLAPVVPGQAMPRWRATGLMRREPVLPLVLPIRNLRVMYGLKRRQYDGFVRNQVPHPHEYFVPMETLIEEGSEANPGVRELVSRAMACANFLPDTAPYQVEERRSALRGFAEMPATFGVANDPATSAIIPAMRQGYVGSPYGGAPFGGAPDAGKRVQPVVALEEQDDFPLPDALMAELINGRSVEETLA